MLIHANGCNRSATRQRQVLGGFIEPLLPTLVDQPPVGETWQHEIKHDGYRTQLALAVDRAQAFTRNGYDWSEKYRPILTAARQPDRLSAILDGEMIVQDERGRSDYDAFRRALGRQPDRLVFYAFDLLGLDGRDLRAAPLIERRDLLRELVGAHNPTFPIQFSEAVAGSGADLLQAACGMGLEGIVSKRLDSPYRSGRQTTWLKTKCYEEGEFTVIGAEHEPGSPAFALLARETGDGLAYVGSAFVTLAGTSRDRFWESVEQHRRSRPVVDVKDGKGRRWTDPVMRVRVQFLAGEHGKLRHASIKALL